MGDPIAPTRRFFAFERVRGGIPELDGLRGIAIVLVLLRHGSREIAAHEGHAFDIGGVDVLAAALNGWAGVDLFFVLSGFLVTTHVVRRWGDRREGIVSTYYAKRALRILPAYYVTLAFVAMGWVPGYPLDEGMWGARVAYHLLFLQDYLPANFVVAFWSLGVEEKFYLLAPWGILALLRLDGATRRIGLVVAVALVPLGLRTWIAAGWGEVIDYDTWFRVFRSPFHACADGLMVGLAVALIVHHRQGRVWGPVPLWAGAALFAALILPAERLDTIGWFDLTLLQTGLAVAGGAMLLGALAPHDGFPHRILRSRPLLWFSNLAYSLYLVHMVFLASTWGVLSTLGGWDTMGPWGRGGLYLATFVAVSAVAAGALHFGVEKPFLRIKDRIGAPRR